MADIKDPGPAQKAQQERKITVRYNSGDDLPVLTDMYGRGVFNKSEDTVEEQVRRFSKRALPTCLKYAIAVVSEPTKYRAKHKDVVEYMKFIERMADKKVKIKDVTPNKGQELSGDDLTSAIGTVVMDD